MKCTHKNPDTYQIMTNISYSGKPEWNTTKWCDKCGAIKTQENKYWRLSKKIMR